jgi:hypothetical protein
MDDATERKREWIMLEGLRPRNAREMTALPGLHNPIRVGQPTYFAWAKPRCSLHCRLKQAFPVSLQTTLEDSFQVEERLHHVLNFPPLPPSASSGTHSQVLCYDPQEKNSIIIVSTLHCIILRYERS